MNQVSTQERMTVAPESASSEEWLELIHKMISSNTHPVLIFGTGNSGKTAMLTSMLSYAKNSSDIDITRIPNFFPPNFPNALEREEASRTLYEDFLPAYDNGVVAPRTGTIYPFFLEIPVGHRGETRNMAFIETNGEWFNRKDGRFQPLKKEIEVLLERFPNAISVIFVAPYDMGGNLEHLRDSHDCLRTAMNVYSEKRRYSKLDSVLYLLSQWDVMRDKGHSEEQFCGAQPDLLIPMLTAHPLAQSWGAFSPPDSISCARRKDFLPYSAGHIVGASVNPPEKRLKPVYMQYRRCLWNWLWGNATEEQGGNIRKVIFPEAAPIELSPLKLSDRLMHLVDGIGSPWA